MCEVEFGRHASDNAFIHQMQFGIGALTSQISSIPHTVAGLKQSNVRPDGANHAGGIPAEHFP